MFMMQSEIRGILMEKYDDIICRLYQENTFNNEDLNNLSLVHPFDYFKEDVRVFKKLEGKSYLQGRIDKCKTK